VAAVMVKVFPEFCRSGKVTNITIIPEIGSLKEEASTIQGGKSQTG
jgi:hypothetical protein